MIHIFGDASWPASLAIVMECLQGGSLAEFIQDKEITIGGFLRLRICLEITSGLAYLHNLEPKRMVHGDLKPENVLLIDDLHCKIADFGSSVVSSYTGKTTVPGYTPQKLGFTPIYAAPELLSNPTAKKHPALDTYSFSIIVCVVLKREAPVAWKNVESLYVEDIKRGECPCLLFMNELKQTFSDQEFAVIQYLKTVMQQCWSHNPSDRPSMAHVHQCLLQIQVNDPATVNKEVATALDKMTISNPVQSDYSCAPLNMLHPPSYQLLQLYQPGKLLLIIMCFVV